MFAVSRLLASNRPVVLQVCYKELELPNIPTDSQNQSFQTTGREMYLRGTPVSEIMRRWRIKFSGAPGEDSEAFLESLTEHRKHGNIADEKLLRCLSVCFDGFATHWYKTRESKIKTWKDFVTAFRKFFGDPEYRDTLIQNIKDRVQGENEPLRDFVLSMRAMFDRLDPPWTEEKKIRRTYWGTKPTIRNAITLAMISSYDELEEALIEAERESDIMKIKRNPKPTEMAHPSLAYDPNRYSANKQLSKGKSGHVEFVNAIATVENTEENSRRETQDSVRKDLRYGPGRREPPAPSAKNFSAAERRDNDSYRTEPKDSWSRNPPPRRPESSANDYNRKAPPRDKQRTGGKPEIQCWNCRRTGHVSRDCREEPKLHCYGCGASGITLNKCRKCNRTSGNAGRSHSVGPERPRSQ